MNAPAGAGVCGPGLKAKGPHRRTGADLICAPKGIRTPDLLFRRQTLYPAELWAHLVFLGEEPLSLELELLYASLGGVPNREPCYLRY